MVGVLHHRYFVRNDVCWRRRTSILEGLSALEASCLDIKQWPFHLKIGSGGGRERSVGEVGARQVGDHDEGVAGIRWPLKEPSILPLGRFFQTFPGFISETFGARRRPSFRLPGGARWGGRGAIAAPRGCGKGGSAEKGVQKNTVTSFRSQQPGPPSAPPASPTRLASLAFQPRSPGPGTGWSHPPARGALPTSESEELF